MSLSRILNDDPPVQPSRPLFTSPARTPLDDHPGFIEPSSVPPTQRSPSYSSHPSPRHDRNREHFPSSRAFQPPSGSYDTARGRDSSSDWHRGIGLGMRGSAVYPDHESQAMFQDEPRDVTYLEEDQDEIQFRKRRKGAHGDSEYQPSGQRRVSNKFGCYIPVFTQFHYSSANENLFAAQNWLILTHL